MTVLATNHFPGLCSESQKDSVTVLEAAQTFVQQFAQENPGSCNIERRLREITDSVGDTGTYEHTSAELVFGARVAWRNAARCIGRLYWNSMTVRDLRHVSQTADIARECVEHLRIATNGGRIRPGISIFAPDRPGLPTARLLNEQLIRYADDPICAQHRELAEQLGWKGSSERFQVMPLLLQSSPDCEPECYEIPEDAVLEVPLTHPDQPEFADLGLRWYAVPAVSNMTLEIGGISYPTAPFSGWYMCTEIGSRNLADADRYGMLPEVARIFALDTSHERTLWQDRALVELNRAVLQSFSQAGVTLADHHSESIRFLAHLDREEHHGRSVPADWSWIVPPLSSSATAVYHRYYHAPDPLSRPSYLHRDTAWSPARPDPTHGM